MLPPEIRATRVENPLVWGKKLLRADGPSLRDFREQHPILASRVTPEKQGSDVRASFKIANPEIVRTLRDQIRKDSHNSSSTVNRP